MSNNRNIIIIFLLIPVCLILLSNSQQIVLADETDWNSLMTDYDKNVINKPVTDEEFNKAIDTVKQYQKKDKKKNKVNKDDKQNQVFDINEKMSLTEPLLRLPFDTINEEYLIKSGIYICEIIENQNKHYLVLKQANKAYAIIELAPMSNETDNFSDSVDYEIKNDNVIIKASKNKQTFEGILKLY